ncbi:MAG TPA: prepilin-type N-terminal cleavage/methylation domain-containing protein [Candidatus Gastranaerophilaceae bacterium]|nr:prepilin-type N-terminal cleavage/methylation domain-containing protein [Candidatus Gastranaerophilaceae bacterium]
MKNKFGFTLAEVMVVLVTLGVLAAIAIPAVVHVRPNNKKVMLKKAYSTLEKAVQELINNDTYYPYEADDGNTGAQYLWGLSTDITPIRVWKGFNYVYNKEALGIPIGDNKFCYLLANSMNTVGAIDCAIFGTHTSMSDANFKTADGITWTMLTNQAADAQFPLNQNDYFNISVDVNGTKDPNCGSGVFTTQSCASSGPDQFDFSVRYDGKIKVSNAAGIIITDPATNH